MLSTMRLLSACLSDFRHQIARFMAALLALVLPSIISGSIMETGVNDYCPWETFNSTCPPGSLVIMNSALYGRMKASRCLESDYEIGCRSDVLAQLDERCSGRPSCLVPLPDQTLQHLQPCKRDLLAYLEASYSCIPVTDGDPSLCLNSGPIRLTQAEGYMSSFMAQAHGHGTSVCPWAIVARPGQRVRLSVLGFSPGMRYRGEAAETGGAGGAGGSDPDADYCHVFAVVTEERRGARRVNLCAENARERALYTSTGHSLGVELSESVVKDSTVSFIIRFTVFGCPDLRPPVNSWTERSGDRVTVRCNDSSQSWHLVCKGTNWIGQTAECHGVPYGDKVVDDSAFPSYGLAIAVIIGIFVGAFCGFLLLAVVLWCRRQNVPRSPRYDHNIELMTTGPTGDPQDHICKVHRIPTGDYGYTHVWELRNTQLPMSGSGCTVDPSDREAIDKYKSAYQHHHHHHYHPHHNDAHGDGMTERRFEHSYECPIMDDNRIPPLSRGPHGGGLQRPFCPGGGGVQSLCQASDQQQQQQQLGPCSAAVDGQMTVTEETDDELLMSEGGGGRTEAEEEAAAALKGFLSNCTNIAHPPPSVVGFGVLDQDPIMAKVPLKIENHYL